MLSFPAPREIVIVHLFPYQILQLLLSVLHFLKEFLGSLFFIPHFPDMSMTKDQILFELSLQLLTQVPLLVFCQHPNSSTG